ncbi:LPXTG cell wall anchor domain-containing protein [Cryobacterium sp. TMT3-29-2]|nr:LPXTG cell wall anchor domain-containing protein [Cryobacterium sp. TMT3-29-2]
MDDEPATAVVARPTLADTGFAAGGTLVLGVLLAGAGILLVATRRRSDVGLLSSRHAQQT